MAERCNSKDLNTANGTKTFDSFNIHYIDDYREIHKLQVYVGDVPTIAHGLTPLSLFKQFGVNIISIHSHHNHKQLMAQSNSNNNVAAMIENSQLNEITTEIRALIRDKIVTSETIENLTNDTIPDTDLENNRDADKLLQRLLIKFKAKDTQKTKSKILQKFLNRILRYEELDTMTDNNQSKFHQKAKELLQQFNNILIKKGDPISKNQSKDMQIIKHEVQLLEDAVPQPGSAFPMDEAVKPIFLAWHDEMVKNGQIQKATTEECKKAMFILAHFPILKRDATAPTLTSRKQIRSFIDFIRYFHQFIQNCTEILSPLQDLSNSKGRYIWTEEHQKSFDDARGSLLNSSALQFQDPNLPYYVHVDAATSNGIGCLLCQLRNGVKHPITFQSRRFNAAEKNYTTTDAELCGIFWAVTHTFKDQLYYAKEIYIYTDHANIIDATSLNKASSRRRKKWLHYLHHFPKKEYIHHAGKSFIDVDTLSRLDVILGTSPAISPLKAMQQIPTNNISDYSSYYRFSQSHTSDFFNKTNQKSSARRRIMQSNIGRYFIK